MRKYIIAVLVVIVAAGGLTSSTHEALTAYLDSHEKDENRSVAIFTAPVNPNLPSALIIGDSISISYTLPVRQRLEGVANVIRPVANCESTLTIRSNLQKIVERLKKTGARLIFATTTPVPLGARSRVPEDVARYNEAALDVMRKNGVEIDDLNSAVVQSAYRFQKPQDVHFYQEGSEILDDYVAATIKAPLARILDSSKNLQRA